MDVVGYVKSGYGSKDKLHELDYDTDLVEMYALHKRKREILLWCYKNISKQTVHKRSSSHEGSGAPPTKGSAYTVKKINNAWAHLSNIGRGSMTHTMSRLVTHSSLDARRKDIQGQVPLLILQQSIYSLERSASRMKQTVRCHKDNSHVEDKRVVDHGYHRLNLCHSAGETTDKIVEIPHGHPSCCCHRVDSRSCLYSPFQVQISLTHHQTHVLVTWPSLYSQISGQLPVYAYHSRDRVNSVKFEHN